MSSLHFTKAPARPAHFSPEEWNNAWIGLEVGLATVYPMTVGYLGRAPVMSIKQKDAVFQNGVFNSWSNAQLDGYLWISKNALLRACTDRLEKKPLIVTWLEEEGQQGRDMFAVPEEVAEYLS